MANTSMHFSTVTLVNAGGAGNVVNTGGSGGGSGGNTFVGTNGIYISSGSNTVTIGKNNSVNLLYQWEAKNSYTDATLIVTSSNGGVVGGLKISSGSNSLALIQPTSTNQPIYHANGGLNNLPYLTFDGVNDGLYISSFSYPADYYVGMIFKINTWTSTMTTFFFGNGFYYGSNGVSTTNQMKFFDSNQYKHFITPQQWCFVFFRGYSASTTVAGGISYVIMRPNYNGNWLGNCMYASNPNAISIGQYSTGANYNSALDFHELFITDASTSTPSMVRNYINNKYGL